MKNGTVSITHLILICVTVVGLKAHVTIMPQTLEASGRDGWITVLIVYIFILAWSWILIYIHKNTKSQHLLVWVKENTSKAISTPLCIIISVYMVISSAVTIKETIIWTRLTYLPETPSVFLIVLFMLLCILLAVSRLQTIVIVNFCVLFFVIILGFFVAITNMPLKDFSLLKPMLEKGWSPVLRGTVYPLSSFTEIFGLLFLQQHLQHSFKYRNIAFLATIIVWLSLGPLIGAITEFGPAEAARQHYPAFEEWGLAHIGRFIEHIDFFSIYQWLTGAFIRTAASLFIVFEVLQLQGKKYKVPAIGIISVILLGLLLIPVSDTEYYKLMKNLLLPATALFYLLLSIFFAALIFFVTAKKRRRKNAPKKIDRSAE